MQPPSVGVTHTWRKPSAFAGRSAASAPTFQIACIRCHGHVPSPLSASGGAVVAASPESVCRTYSSRQYALNGLTPSAHQPPRKRRANH
eukprot:3945531-Prymnesium_polylepis.1